MEKLDFNIEKKNVYKVNVYGNSYELTKPTVRQAEEIRVRMKDVGEDSQVDVMVDFLSKCGLPTEVSDQMEVEHFVSLTEFLVGAKKND